MKTSFLPFAIVISALLLTGCVQPYSFKSFYKAKHTATAPSDAADAAGSLSYNDIVSVSTIDKPTELEISKALKKLNPHWRVKGFDQATGALFFFNFSSKNDEETFILYPKKKTAEYVTTNTSHYAAIVKDLKAGGYKPAGTSANGDEQYANGDNSVALNKVVIFDGSTGYKFTF